MNGRDLAAAFFNEIVADVMTRHFPDATYSAGLLGPGSEVLGYDSEMSRDHDWGPRCHLFFDDGAEDVLANVWTMLARELPRAYEGYPVDFGNTHRPDSPFPVPTDGVAHQVGVYDRGQFFVDYLGFDPLQSIDPFDWLSTPTQKLLSITRGSLFRDDLDVENQQARLDFYPDEVWRFAMASTWARIGENEHLIGRAAMTSETGWRSLAATVSRDLMHLAFLQERRYAPYPKWFGTAFTELRIADRFPEGSRLFGAADYDAFANAYVEAIERLAEAQNALGLAEPAQARAHAFHDRPFQVIGAERFAHTLLATLAGSDFARLPGTIDQITDNVAVLTSPKRCRALIRSLLAGGSQQK